MNIFVFDNKKIENNALYLDDKRLNKMILETAQLMSNWLYLNKKPHFYKPTHLNHPATKWLMKDEKHFKWLYFYFIELNKERSHRGFKEHLSYTKAIKENIDSKKWGYKSYSIEEFVNIEFENITPHKDLETTKAYRRLLKEKWENDKQKPKWTNRKPHPF